ncbi:MAG: nucleotidyltransferase domain-containing protein [Proteobacteria bacterium]|nr:nucleotidyltransferase domain-containing protein [Pseudomonadota bacterium]
MKYKDFDGGIGELVRLNLRQLEAGHGIRIVHAVESGSRAWGFASPDSDYDVRFIYIRPMSYYLSLGPKNDYIDGVLDETLDINGWDITKVLQHVYRSNASVYEWLNSPVVYETSPLMMQVNDVCGAFFSSKAALCHYWGTARNNYETYLKEDMVKYKKYFYVLRPLLACQWIEQKRCPPPVLFQTLLDDVTDLGLKAQIEALRAQKVRMTEAEKGPRLSDLNAYIEDRLGYYRELSSNMPDDRKYQWDALDSLFLRLV